MDVPDHSIVPDNARRNAFSDFPSFHDWINQHSIDEKEKESDSRGQEVEEFHFGQGDTNRVGQEVEETHLGFKPYHGKGQELEDIFFGHDDNRDRGQEVEEIHFGPKPEKGQELEEIHLGSKPERGQEVEEIHFGSKPETGQQVEEIHFGHKGQEAEEINFGSNPSHEAGQEVEDILFGHHDKHPKGQEVEEMQFGPKPEKGQEVEEIQFGPKPEKGQEVEEIHFGPKPEKGQELEEIHFGSKPDHGKGQEIEDIHFGHKNTGQEVEEINFGSKPHHETGQELENIQLGHNNEGQLLEEINFGAKPHHETGQEPEDIHFGHKDNGQEAEEINFGTKPKHEKGQEVEDIIFGRDDDHRKGQEVEEINFGSKPHHEKGQEPEEIHFGHKDSGDEVEEINFGPYPHQEKGQKAEEIHSEHKDDGQITEGINFEPTKDHEKGQEVEDIHFGHKENNKNGDETVKDTESNGNWFDIFLPEVNPEDCKENPATPPNSFIECQSHRCELFCQKGFRLSSGTDRIAFECSSGKWISHDNVTAECHPDCEPPCQNDGVCVAPNQCSCPENFGGTHCQFRNRPCTEQPPVPQNSYVNCNSSNCLIKCFDNYVFPDGSSAVGLTCHHGQWTLDRNGWQSVPNCKPSCDPPCLNGGSCLDFNKCQCPREYAGPQCQFEIAVCDAQKLNFNGFYTCRGENDKVSCTISCPEGQASDIPIAESYICHYSVGKFVPEPVPKCLYDKNTEIVKFHSSSHTIQGGFEGFDSTLTHNIPSTAKCYSWRRSHYRNFDGKVFSFDGNCSYILAEDIVGGSFRIKTTKTNCDTTCSRHLKIYYQHTEYDLHFEGLMPVLMANGEILKVPNQLGGLLSEITANQISVTLQTVDVNLKWDSEDTFTVTVNENMRNKTGGLCGNFNGDAEDDFHTPEGFPAANLEAFVQSWVDEPYNCDSSPDTKSDCRDENATHYCEKIFSDAHFEKCLTVEKFALYKEACIWDMCECGKNCACDTVSKFVKNCKEYFVLKGIPDSTSDWRQIADCPLNCGAGKVYSACGPLFQPTCGSFGMDNSLAKYSECFEGCYCPDGLLEFNNSCVRREYCPCYWRNMHYQRGDVIMKDCNTCSCQNGEWTCTSLQCSSRCSVVGDSHYLTFDGRRYDLMGQCSYFLLKSDDYSIASENSACEGDLINEIFHNDVSKFSSCSKLITIRHKKDEIKLKMKKQITINGLEVSTLPVGIDGVVIRKTSHHVIVTLPDHVEIWWDGISNVYIDIPGNYTKATGGLCGTFTNNQKDDFMTPEGDIEQTAPPFAEKWKMDETCTEIIDPLRPHPCDENIHNKETAEKICEKLKSVVFKECHPFVDVEPFYKNCLTDVCSCQKETSSCTCPIFSDYASECARQYVDLPWRNEIHECGLHCRNGEVYQSCGDSCRRSCRDISIMNGRCDKKCAEGCGCPDGLVLNSIGECVPVSKCPCFHENIEYRANHEIIMETINGSQLCICENALWSCRPATKLELARDYENSEHKCDESKHEEYTNCQPAEPKTCKNMHEKPKHSTRVCFPGCVCKKGFVWDSIGKVCVNSSECPCHHGGRSYTDGEEIQQECNSCTCMNGVWSCTQGQCPAICSTWGDSHFKTFDGKIYDFQGSCQFVMASGSVSDHESFFISLQIMPCGSTGISCPKSLTLRVESLGKEEKVVFKKSNRLEVPSGLERILVREVGLFVLAEVFDLGISVQWDRGTRVYVKADARWKNKMKGLCGSFNDNEVDDFKTPSSGETNEISAVLFADSWRLDSCPQSNPITDTCAQRPHRKAWAVDKCSVLNSEIFERCHSEVALEPYLERCVVDTCGCDEGGDCDCLCAAIAAYAEECTLKGIPIKWRSQDLCPLQCDDYSNYSPCVSTCPPKSCENQYKHSAILQTCSEESCVEGCDRPHCPAGHVFADSHSNRCVPIASCQTVCLTVNNITYLEGDLMESDDCHSCYCSHHTRVCMGEPCSKITTTVIPPATSVCPEGEVWDDCIVKCDHVCNNLMGNSDLQCSHDCIPGCRKIDFNCPNGMFLRDKHTCVQKKDCPCKSTSDTLVKPGEVVQESDCEKCQCVNNEYECIHICTPPSIQTTQPTYNYTRKQYTVSPGWDFSQGGNVTLIHHRPTTIAPVLCPSERYESLLDSLTKFSASSYLDEASSPKYSQISSKGSWTAGANNADQYLQIDLMRVEPIYAVNVAGDSGNYVTSYHLLYSLNGVEFKNLFNHDGRKQIFGGPFDGHHSVKQVLPTPIEARFIRFHPISWHGQIEMKVDVLGCKDLLPSTTPHPIPSICNRPIGIGQKYFPKLQIIVTSSKPNHGPDLIGFDNEKGWQPLTNSKSEWVQLDFGEFVNFTGITTKGISQGNELSSSLLGDSWVERYKVEYSHDGFTWNPVLDEFGDQMTFVGNFDGETEQKNFFKRPIRAKALKILPVKWHENIALRLDLMGCYEPSHSPLEVTPPVIIPTTECNLCPGAVIIKEHCTCKEEEWWDGENCVGRSECPCYRGLIAYPVGSTFTTEHCEECVCRLNGLAHCIPKQCEECPHGLQKVLTPLCGCTCKPCEENTRLCPTSNVCLENSAWCDGIQDCPDDERNCTTPSPKVTAAPTSVPCTAVCPPGYDIVYRKKTLGPTEADDMIQNHGVKSIKTKKSVKTYRKSKKNRKFQKLTTECPPYDCVPVREVTATACPPLECPLHYLVVYQSPNEKVEEACPLYACEPIPEYANCSVLSKNIKTFDGVEYKYEICDHVLATHDSELWNVTVVKNCSFGVGCVSIFVINHGNHSLELIPQHHMVIFDSFPYTSEQVQILGSKMSDFTLNIIGDSIIFSSDIYAFQVVCDVNDNFQIKVSSQMKGHLAGLCGVYNGDPHDDRTLPDGKLSKTTVEFGDGWRNPGGKECIETVCPIQMQTTALDICLKLKEKPFNLCHNHIDLELCIESTCDCLTSNETIDNCRCRTLSGFASKCKNSNLFGWRMEHDCPSSCPPNLVHYDCYPYACQPTCGNEECTETTGDCYSGCFCQDGLVKRGDQCIKVQECRDCVCSGLGDSTYLTFDGGLTFNGNCTYVATREKTSTGSPAFEVLITNTLCNKTDHMTCTTEIEVHTSGHTVKIIALPETEQMVIVFIDGMEANIREMENLDKVWGKITYNPEVSAVHVELPREHVDVRYFYKRFAFTISLPSHFYSGKVEGLCGTCSQSQDETEDGVNPEEWQTEDGKSCLIEPPLPCVPTADQRNICLLMNETKLFAKCLAFVDPMPFVDQCFNLVCLNGHLCNSLEAYAQACRDAGVCVDWRSQDFCPFTCPSDLQYRSCNIGCHKTCDNYDEIFTTCTNPPVEGCFCPEDQILINGTCKPEKYCELCDEDGHHFEDEMWSVDKCTNCTCRNHVITCEKTECPGVELACGEDETLVAEENGSVCCPEHKCVCRHRDECPKVEIPVDLSAGMEAVMNESGCCPKVEFVCNREKCPKPLECREHYIQKVHNATACCPEYYCEKPENICIYEFAGSEGKSKGRVEREEKKEIVKEIGERWTDGPCKTCVCTEADGEAEIVCSVTECPSLEHHHDYNDYELEEIHEPEKCCPEVTRKSCKHGGRVYKVGDTWIPDESNPCETMKCNDWGGGSIMKETRLEVCNRDCEPGWEYKHSEGSCCGRCVQTGCLADEKIYKPGEFWFSEDKCSKSICKEHNGHYSISTEMESCPFIGDCPPEDIYKDKCCLKCKMRPEDKKICDAQSLPEESTVHMVSQRKGRHGLCRNVHPIGNFTQCAGTCDSYTVFNTETSLHDSVCKCCKPQEYSLITVSLQCEDGKEFTKTVTVPSKCSCMPCGS